MFLIQNNVIWNHIIVRLSLIFFLNIYKEQPILIYSKSEHIAFSSKFDKLSNKLYISKINLSLTFIFWASFAVCISKWLH